MDILDSIRRRGLTTVVDIVVAFFLALVVGFSPVNFGIFFFLISLRVFAIPLFFFVPVQPLWIYYVIVIEWLVGYTSTVELEKKNDNTNTKT